VKTSLPGKGGENMKSRCDHFEARLILYRMRIKWDLKRGDSAVNVADAAFVLPSEEYRIVHEGEAGS
jgi:hypothetical protein